MHAASDDNVCAVGRGWRDCQITIDQLEGGYRLPSVYGVYPQRPYGTQLVVDVAQLFRDVQGGRPCAYAMLRRIVGSHLWPSKRSVQLHPAPLIEVWSRVEVAERLGYGDQAFVEQGEAEEQGQSGHGQSHRLEDVARIAEAPVERSANARHLLREIL
jgi:hypothetical protein